MAIDDIITLAYGSGGKKTSQLIDELIVPAFSNNILAALSDGAILTAGEKIVFSTDSFVVNPYFFPGGDIGKLAVCGTVNDISMCGGEPKYLSLSFIIEEGFKTEELKRIIKSIKETAELSGVAIVTGDTKVVEKGKGDGIYINTSGIGLLKQNGYGEARMMPGDVVIVSGNVGDHGIAVMAARNNMIGAGELVSDCAPLNALASELFTFGEDVRIMRDPTRGGLATTLNEFIERNKLCIELEEDKIPISRSVNNACDILGLDPLYSANEGKLIAIVNSHRAGEIIAALKKHPEGVNSAVIGEVTENYPGRVVIKTYLGGTRILTKLSGAQLPRIC